MDKEARRLRLKHQDYASAAISYFAESGLDPSKTSKYSLLKVMGTINVEAEKTRAHNADIGNRLVAILRSFERNNGQYLQAQQGDMLVYQERIERNILTYLAGIEEKVLAPILEHGLRTGAEARITRVLAEVLVLKLEKHPYSEEKLRASVAKYDEQRERQTILVAEKVIAASKLAKPILSARPAVQEPPKPVPTKQPATTATSNSATPDNSSVTK